MKRITGVVLMFSLMFTFAFVAADESDTLTVKVTVLEPRIGISVPDEVIFPDIAAGYLSERQDLNIENIGTVDIKVSLELDSGYIGTIFQNLAFRRILKDPLIEIGDFDFKIMKPKEVGGIQSKNIYMYLDLKDYSEEITSDIIDHEAEVIFVAVAL